MLDSMKSLSDENFIIDTSDDDEERAPLSEASTITAATSSQSQPQSCPPACAICYDLPAKMLYTACGHYAICDMCFNVLEGVTVMKCNDSCQVRI